MAKRLGPSERADVTLRGPMVAVVVTAVLGLWPIPIRGQVSVGTTTPGGSKVGMGIITDDPSGDAEAQRERRQKRFQELITQARAHVEAEEWRPARKRLDEARRNVTDKTADLPPLRELYQALETQGQTMLNAANGAYIEQDYGTALTGYREIALAFKGLPSAQQAADALDAAEEDEAVQMYLADQVAMGLDRKIDTIIATHAAQAEAADEDGSADVSRLDAIRVLPVDEQVEVVQVMESMVDRFSATPTGARVKVELAALEADEALMARINAARHDRKADQALGRAKMYRKGGMLEKALGFYQTVASDYPETEAAAEARKAIAEITEQLGQSGSK